MSPTSPFAYKRFLDLYKRTSVSRQNQTKNAPVYFTIILSEWTYYFVIICAIFRGIWWNL